MSENEYKDLVLAAFDRQFDANHLSQELVSPTAGSLKAEAIKVCSKRFDPKDELVLSSFLIAESGVASHLRVIQNCDYQIFKPLSQFLNNRKKGTTFKNIQLLAWLIDFKPRPYNPALVMPEPRNKISNPSGNGGTTKIKIGQIGEGSGTIKWTRDKLWFIGLSFILVGGLIWWFRPKDNNCMYWENDHYVATSCSVPKTDTPLVQLDEAKLHNFRRIKKVDTLTTYSVNRLWWVRVADSIEVYTTGGRHPLYADKKLKLVTDYIVNDCRDRRNKYK